MRFFVYYSYYTFWLFPYSVYYLLAPKLIRRLTKLRLLLNVRSSSIISLIASFERLLRLDLLKRIASSLLFCISYYFGDEPSESSSMLLTRMSFLGALGEVGEQSPSSTSESESKIFVSPILSFKIPVKLISY